MNKKKKVWTKFKCPFHLEDFYETQNLRLRSFRDGSEHLYDSINFSVKYNGFDIPIYSKYLAMILNVHEEVKLTKDPQITIYDVQTAFLNAYHNGIEDFKLKHAISIDNLYNHSETYVKKIKRLYYEEMYGNRKGCSYLKDWHPVISTLEGMKNAGFAYGHLIEIEKLVNTEKELFADVLNKPKKKNSFKPNLLLDFFGDSCNTDLISAIKKNFGDYKNKDMAILIYLLDKEYDLITIHNKSKGKSRKSFVESLTGKQHKSIQSINNYFEATTEVLKTIGKSDSSYIEIKKKLDKIVSSC